MIVDLLNPQQLIDATNATKEFFKVGPPIELLEMSTQDIFHGSPSEDELKQLDQLGTMINKRTGLIEARSIGSSVLLSALFLGAGTLLKQETIGLALGIGSMVTSVFAFWKIERTYGRFANQLRQQVNDLS